MIDLSSLRKTDIGRPVAYQSSADSESGLLAGWNHKFVFVQFHVEDWQNFPCRFTCYTCAPLFPEHVAFVRTNQQAGKQSSNGSKPPRALTRQKISRAL